MVIRKFQNHITSVIILILIGLRVIGARETRNVSGRTLSENNKSSARSATHRLRPNISKFFFFFSVSPVFDWSIFRGTIIPKSTACCTPRQLTYSYIRKTQQWYYTWWNLLLPMTVEQKAITQLLSSLPSTSSLARLVLHTTPPGLLDWDIDEIIIVET